MKFHKPCLLTEILNIVESNNCKFIVDCTAGEGGHTTALAEKVGKSGKIIAIEYDPEYFSLLIENVEKLENVEAVNASYVNLPEILKNLNFPPPDAIIFDLGISSFQLDKSGRGFSFKKDEPLDMRFNPKIGKPLFQIIQTLSEKEVENILTFFGETRFARKLAKAIYESRKNIKTTADLNKIIEKNIPQNYVENEFPKIYQAFRIFINKELRNILDGIKNALYTLKINGVLITISYHSIEDRICKNLKHIRGIKNLTKKPIVISEIELKSNPRCRSAHLRVFKKEGLNEEDLRNWYSAFYPPLSPDLYG
ncbi:MAG: 16S rRNA (cytosine(1402)-N(4))-methyltransferase RsmH [candidate division WOR-3 bacterium]